MIDALGSSSPSDRLTLLAAASSCAQRAADLARSDLSASSGNDDNLVVLSALLAGGEAAKVRRAASRAVALNPGDAAAWGLLVVASAASSSVDSGRPSHAWRMRSSAASNNARFFADSTPYASNIERWNPRPTPRITRPFETRSRAATSDAACSGCRMGSR